MDAPSAPVWGSIERNTATWCPYPDQEAVESACQRGERSIFLPACFNATVHFMSPPHNHYQLTPAVGTKPAGFRSVLRGTVGQVVTVFWHATERMWRLDHPGQRPGEDAPHTCEVTIDAAPPARTEVRWQWCDLSGEAFAHALEANWHGYADEHSDAIEAAWAQGQSCLSLVIGLSQYEVHVHVYPTTCRPHILSPPGSDPPPSRLGSLALPAQIRDFDGSYAIQHNVRSQFKRRVRRGLYAAGVPRMDDSLQVG